MAALAHLSILLPHFGVLVPLILWLANKDTAPFAAYQAKQAFWFHLLTIIGFWIAVFFGLIFGFLTLGLGFLALLPLLAVWHLAADIYGVIGAVQAFQGRDFRYYFIDSLVQPD